ANLERQDGRGDRPRGDFGGETRGAKDPRRFAREPSGEKTGVESHEDEPASPAFRLEHAADRGDHAASVGEREIFGEDRPPPGCPEFDLCHRRASKTGKTFGPDTGSSVREKPS